MQLQHLQEARELSSYSNWKKPRLEDLKKTFEHYKNKEETRWRDRTGIIHSIYPLFADFEDFSEQILHSEIKEIGRSFVEKVHGMSNLASVASVKSLVSTYSTSRDVSGIAEKFKNNEPVKMPIIVKGKTGYWIFSGNTRANIALAKGFKVKAIIVDLSEEKDEA